MTAVLSSPLDVRREGAVQVLTLNDPETRNALQPAVYQEGLAALRRAEAEGARAVVLTGAGGTFCSGGNLRRLRQRDAGQGRRNIAAFHAFVRALRDTPLPVIAAVEGAAAGAGFSLAVACDLVVAARDARFVMAYVRVGLNPDGGASALLSRGLPHQVVAEILFEGGVIAAERLHGYGVVNRLAAPGEARDTALTWARRLASGPRAALGRAKRLIEAAQHTPLAPQLDLEADLFLEAAAHPEAAEGMNAFLDKRTPAFADKE